MRDAIAGIIGGLYSVASTKTQLHISVPEQQWFRIRKVSGCPSAIVASSGADVDIDIGELRFGERKELLVELDMSFGTGFGAAKPGGKDAARDLSSFANATDAFFYSQTGISPADLQGEGSSSEPDSEVDDVLEEVPLFQVTATYRDPIAGKTVTRLNHNPTLLTITVIPPSFASVRGHSQERSAPDIVRRRMELLSSDMLRRATLLMTRRQDAQAIRLLDETKRIIQTILSSSLDSNGSGRATTVQHARADVLARGTLSACLEAVSAMADGCTDRVQFEQLGRYMSEYLAIVLRDQRSWTGKSAVERLFWTTDNSRWMVAQSLRWVETR